MAGEINGWMNDKEYDTTQVQGVCAPYLDWEKQTGYYKNRYQQSSQEQMVRRSYTHTVWGCKCTDAYKQSPGLEHILMGETLISTAALMLLSHPQRFISSLLFGSVSSPFQFCYGTNPHLLPWALSIHPPDFLHCVTLKWYDYTFEYEQTLMSEWSTALSFDGVLDSGSRQQHLCPTAKLLITGCREAI